MPHKSGLGLMSFLDFLKNRRAQGDEGAISREFVEFLKLAQDPKTDLAKCIQKIDDIISWINGVPRTVGEERVLGAAWPQVDFSIRETCPVQRQNTDPHTKIQVQLLGELESSLDQEDNVRARSVKCDELRDQTRAKLGELRVDNDSLQQTGVLFSRYTKAQQAYHRAINGIIFQLDFRASRHSFLRPSVLFSAAAQALRAEIQALIEEVTQKRQAIQRLEAERDARGITQHRKKEIKERITAYQRSIKEIEVKLGSDEKLTKKSLDSLKGRLHFLENKLETLVEKRGYRYDRARESFRLSQKTERGNPDIVSTLVPGFHAQLAGLTYAFNNERQEKFYLDTHPSKEDPLPGLHDCLFALAPEWTQVSLVSSNPFEFVHINSESLQNYYEQLKVLKQSLTQLKDNEIKVYYQPAVLKGKKLLTLHEYGQLSREIDNYLSQVDTVTSQLIYEMARRVRAANYGLEYRRDDREGDQVYFFDDTAVWEYMTKHKDQWVYPLRIERSLGPVATMGRHDEVVIKTRYGLSLDLLQQFKVNIHDFVVSVPEDRRSSRLDFILTALQEGTREFLGGIDIIDDSPVHLSQFCFPKDGGLTSEELQTLISGDNKIESVAALIHSPEFRILFEFREGGQYRDPMRLQELLERYGYWHLVTPSGKFIFDQMYQNVIKLLEQLNAVHIFGSGPLLDKFRGVVDRVFVSADGNRSQIVTGLDLCKKHVFEYVYTQSNEQLNTFWQRMLHGLYDLSGPSDDFIQAKRGEFELIVEIIEYLLKLRSAYEEPGLGRAATLDFPRINIFEPVLDLIRSMCAKVIPTGQAAQLAQRHPISTIKQGVAAVFSWVSALGQTLSEEFAKQLTESHRLVSKLLDFCDGEGFDEFSEDDLQQGLVNFERQVSQLYASVKETERLQHAKHFLNYIAVTFVAFDVKSMLGLLGGKRQGVNGAELDQFDLRIGKIRFLIRYDADTGALVKQQLNSIALLSKGPTAAIQWFDALIARMKIQELNLELFRCAYSSSERIHWDSAPGRDGGEMEYPMSNYPVNHFYNTLQIYCVIAPLADIPNYRLKLSGYKEVIESLAPKMIQIFKEVSPDDIATVDSYRPDFHFRLIRQFTKTPIMIGYGIAAFNFLLQLECLSERLDHLLTRPVTFGRDWDEYRYAHEFFQYAIEKHADFSRQINNLLLNEIKKGVFRADTLYQGTVILTLLYGSIETKIALHTQLLSDFYFSENETVKDVAIQKYQNILNRLQPEGEDLARLMQEGVSSLNQLLRADMQKLKVSVEKVTDPDAEIFKKLRSFNLTNNELFFQFGCESFLEAGSHTSLQYYEVAFQFIIDATEMSRDRLPENFAKVLQSSGGTDDQSPILDPTPYFYQYYSYSPKKVLDIFQLFIAFIARFLTEEKFCSQELMPLFIHLFADPENQTRYPMGYNEYHRFLTGSESVVEAFRIKYVLEKDFFNPTVEFLLGRGGVPSYVILLKSYYAGVTQNDDNKRKQMQTMLITFLGQHIAEASQVGDRFQNDSAKQLRMLSDKLTVLQTVIQSLLEACSGFAEEDISKLRLIQPLSEQLLSHKQAVETFIDAVVFFVPRASMDDMWNLQRSSANSAASASGRSMSILSRSIRGGLSVTDATVSSLQGEGGDTLEHQHPVRQDYHCVFNNGIFSVLKAELADAIRKYFKSYPTQLRDIQDRLEVLINTIKHEAPLALAHIHVLNAFVGIITANTQDDVSVMKRNINLFEIFYLKCSTHLHNLWARKPFREIFDVLRDATYESSRISIQPTSSSSASQQAVEFDLLWVSVCQLATDPTVFDGDKLRFLVDRFFGGDQTLLDSLQRLAKDGGVFEIKQTIFTHISEAAFSQALADFNKLKSMLAPHEEAWGYAEESIAECLLEWMKRLLINLEAGEEDASLSKADIHNLYPFIQACIERHNGVPTPVAEAMLDHSALIKQAVIRALLVQYNRLIDGNEQERPHFLETVDRLRQLLLGICNSNDFTALHMQAIELQVIERLFSEEVRRSVRLHPVYGILKDANYHSKNFQDKCKSFAIVSEPLLSEAYTFFADRTGFTQYWKVRYLRILSRAMTSLWDYILKRSRDTSEFRGILDQVKQSAILPGMDFDNIEVSNDDSFAKLSTADKDLLKLFFYILRGYNNCVVLRNEQDLLNAFDEIDREVAVNLLTLSEAQGGAFVQEIASDISSQGILHRLSMMGGIESNVRESNLRESKLSLEKQIQFLDSLRRFYFVFELIKRGCFAEALHQFNILEFSLKSSDFTLDDVIARITPKANLTVWIEMIDRMSALVSLQTLDRQALFDCGAKDNLIDAVVGHLFRVDRQQELNQQLQVFSELLILRDQASDASLTLPEEQIAHFSESIRAVFKAIDLDLLRQLRELFKHPDRFNVSATHETEDSSLVQEFLLELSSSKEQAMLVLRKAKEIIVRHFLSGLVNHWKGIVLGIITDSYRCMSKSNSQLTSTVNESLNGLDSSRIQRSEGSVSSEDDNGLADQTMRVDIEDICSRVRALQVMIEGDSSVLAKDLQALFASLQLELANEKLTLTERLKRMLGGMMPETDNADNLYTRFSGYVDYLPSIVAKISERVQNSKRCVSGFPFTGIHPEQVVKHINTSSIFSTVVDALIKQSTLLDYVYYSPEPAAVSLRTILLSETLDSVKLITEVSLPTQKDLFWAAFKVCLQIESLYPIASKQGYNASDLFSIQILAKIQTCIEANLSTVAWGDSLSRQTEALIRIYRSIVDSIIKAGLHGSPLELKITVDKYRYQLQKKIFEYNVSNKLHAFQRLAIVYKPSDSFGGSVKLLPPEHYRTFSKLLTVFQELLVAEHRLCEVLGMGEGDHYFLTHELEISLDKRCLENLKLQFIVDAFRQNKFSDAYTMLQVLFHASSSSPEAQMISCRHEKEFKDLFNFLWNIIESPQQLLTDEHLGLFDKIMDMLQEGVLYGPYATKNLLVTNTDVLQERGSDKLIALVLQILQPQRVYVETIQPYVQTILSYVDKTIDVHSLQQHLIELAKQLRGFQASLLKANECGSRLNIQFNSDVNRLVLEGVSQSFIIIATLKQLLESDQRAVALPPELKKLSEELAKTLQCFEEANAAGMLICEIHRVKDEISSRLDCAGRISSLRKAIKSAVSAGTVSVLETLKQQLPEIRRILNFDGLEVVVLFKTSLAQFVTNNIQKLAEQCTLVEDFSVLRDIIALLALKDIPSFTASETTWETISNFCKQAQTSLSPVPVIYNYNRQGSSAPKEEEVTSFYHSEITGLTRALSEKQGYLKSLNTNLRIMMLQGSFEQSTLDNFLLVTSQFLRDSILLSYRVLQQEIIAYFSGEHVKDEALSFFAVIKTQASDWNLWQLFCNAACVSDSQRPKFHDSNVEKKFTHACQLAASLDSAVSNCARFSNTTDLEHLLSGYAAVTNALSNHPCKIKSTNYIGILNTFETNIQEAGCLRPVLSMLISLRVALFEPSNKETLAATVHKIEGELVTLRLYDEKLYDNIHEQYKATDRIKLEIGEQERFIRKRYNISPRVSLSQELFTWVNIPEKEKEFTAGVSLISEKIRGDIKGFKEVLSKYHKLLAQQQATSDRFQQEKIKAERDLNELNHRLATVLKGDLQQAVGDRFSLEQQARALQQKVEKTSEGGAKLSVQEELHRFEEDLEIFNRIFQGGRDQIVTALREKYIRSCLTSLVILHHEKLGNTEEDFQGYLKSALDISDGQLLAVLQLSQDSNLATLFKRSCADYGKVYTAFMRYKNPGAVSNQPLLGLHFDESDASSGSSLLSAIARSLNQDAQHLRETLARYLESRIDDLWHYRSDSQGVDFSARLEEPVVQFRATVGEEECVFSEAMVPGDGDCGFNAIGSDRQSVVNCLRGLVNHPGQGQANRNRLRPEIQEAFESQALRAESVDRLLEVRTQKQDLLDEGVRTLRDRHSEWQPEQDQEQEDQITSFIDWLRKRDFEQDSNDLSQRRLAIFQAEDALNLHYASAEVVRQYLDALGTGGLWLGYQSALLYAEENKINLYIWREDEAQPGHLALINLHEEDSNPRNTYHILHTNGYTHFNVLYKSNEPDHDVHADFKGYIQDIREGKEWDDQFEWQCLQAVIENRPIIVFHSKQNPAILGDLRDYTGEPIFIYCDDGRYSKSVLEADKKPRDMLNEILDRLRLRQRVTYDPRAQFNTYSQIQTEFDESFKVYLSVLYKKLLQVQAQDFFGEAQLLVTQERGNFDQLSKNCQILLREQKAESAALQQQLERIDSFLSRVHLTPRVLQLMQNDPIYESVYAILRQLHFIRHFRDERRLSYELIGVDQYIAGRLSVIEQSDKLRAELSDKINRDSILAEPETVAFMECLAEFRKFSLSTAQQARVQQLREAYLSTAKAIGGFLALLSHFPRDTDLDSLERDSQQLFTQVQALVQLRADVVDQLPEEIIALFSYDLVQLEEFMGRVKKQLMVCQYYLATGLVDLETKMRAKVDGYNRKLLAEGAGISLSAAQYVQAIAQLVYEHELPFLQLPSQEFSDAQLNLVNQRISLYPVVREFLRVKLRIEIISTTEFDYRLNHCIFLAQQICLSSDSKSKEKDLVELAMYIYQAERQLESGIVNPSNRETFALSAEEKYLFICQYVQSSCLPKFNQSRFLKKFFRQIQDIRVQASDTQDANTSIAAGADQYREQRIAEESVARVVTASGVALDAVRQQLSSRQPREPLDLKGYLQGVLKRSGIDLDTLNSQSIDLLNDLKEILLRVFDRMYLFGETKSLSSQMIKVFLPEVDVAVSLCLLPFLQLGLSAHGKEKQEVVDQNSYQLRKLIIEQYFLILSTELMTVWPRVFTREELTTLRAKLQKFHDITELCHQDLQQYVARRLDVRCLLQELYQQASVIDWKVEGIFSPLFRLSVQEESSLAAAAGADAVSVNSAGSARSTHSIDSIAEECLDMESVSIGLERAVFTGWAKSADRLKQGAWQDHVATVKTAATLCLEKAKQVVSNSFGEEGALFEFLKVVVGEHPYKSVRDRLLEPDFEVVIRSYIQHYLATSGAAVSVEIDPYPFCTNLLKFDEIDNYFNPIKLFDNINVEEVAENAVRYFNAQFEPTEWNERFPLELTAENKDIFICLINCIKTSNFARKEYQHRGTPDGQSLETSIYHNLFSLLTYLRTYISDSAAFKALDANEKLIQIREIIENNRESLFSRSSADTPLLDAGLENVFGRAMSKNFITKRVNKIFAGKMSQVFLETFDETLEKLGPLQDALKEHETQFNEEERLVLLEIAIDARVDISQFKTLVYVLLQKRRAQPEFIIDQAVAEQHLVALLAFQETLMVIEGDAFELQTLKGRVSAWDSFKRSLFMLDQSASTNSFSDQIQAFEEKFKASQALLDELLQGFSFQEVSQYSRGFVVAQDGRLQFSDLVYEQLMLCCFLGHPNQDQLKQTFRVSVSTAMNKAAENDRWLSSEIMCCYNSREDRANQQAVHMTHANNELYNSMRAKGDFKLFSNVSSLQNEANNLAQEQNSVFCTVPGLINAWNEWPRKSLKVSIYKSFSELGAAQESYATAAEADQRSLEELECYKQSINYDKLCPLLCMAPTATPTRSIRAASVSSVRASSGRDRSRSAFSEEEGSLANGSRVTSPLSSASSTEPLAASTPLQSRAGTNGHAAPATPPRNGTRRTPPASPARAAAAAGVFSHKGPGGRARSASAASPATRPPSSGSSSGTSSGPSPAAPRNGHGGAAAATSPAPPTPTRKGPGGTKGKE